MEEREGQIIVRVRSERKRAGIGRKTRQYNPTGDGAQTLGQWMNAVMSMKGQGGDMSVEDAVEISADAGWLAPQRR